MLTANVVIDVALLPEIGIVAGAIGNDVAYAIWVPGHLWILHRLLGLELRPQVLGDPRDGRRGRRSGATPADRHRRRHRRAGARLALSCVVYLVALRLIGELARDDIDFLRGLVARRFAWARR